MRAALVLLLATIAWAPPSPGGPPYSPQDALQHFQLEPGFRIELVASEPDVQSPIAMDIDERGRWFVLEMPGYPVDTRPTGRVKLLEDTDGDGRPDTSRVFADHLVLPTGVMRWKRGVIVTAAPDVLYLEDTNDDGVADRREVLLTGFAQTNPQHRVNTPLYGLDNWIYLAHEGPAGAIIYTDLFGDLGHALTMPRFPNTPPLDPERRSVRFRPDTGELELLSGQSQYGQAFDAWGRYFGSNNSNHIRLEMLAARYLARTPEMPRRLAMDDISDHGTAAQVFPITEHPTFELLTEAGEFTSACSLTPYTGGLFADEYAASTFVAEPVHNLVHRDVLEPNGASLRARRGSERREFLASTDAWFRPVSFYIGPDGGLYVIDYYRKRIEHPEWTSTEFQKDPSEFSLGIERGRIYRIVPDGTAAAHIRPALDRAQIPGLVGALAHANLWWRRTAQRLLLDRGDIGAAPALAALAQDVGRPAVGRVHALWTLNGLSQLDDPLLLRMLDDPVAHVREHALQLAEPRLSRSSPLAAAVVARAARESDARARFQLVATLGFLRSPDAADATTRLLFENIDDPWMQRSALSGGSDRAPLYLRHALGTPETAHAGTLTAHDSPARRTFFHDIGHVIGARHQRDEVAEIVAAVAGRTGADAEWWQAALLNGMHDGLGSSNIAVLRDEQSQLLALADRDESGVRAGALSLLRLTGLSKTPGAARARARAQRIAGDARASDERRADAIALLAIAGAERHKTLLLHFIHPTQPERVQVAALDALQAVKGSEIARLVLPRWSELTPGARSALVDVLLTTPERQRLLVDALEHGAVQPWALSFWQKRDLLMNKDPQIRTAARELLEDSPERRAEVVNRYAAVVERGGDAARGQQVFARVCAACHRLGDAKGASELGPDLATVRHRPALSLLVDVLLPSQSIAQGYETYVVETREGRTESGTLASQDSASIALRRAGGIVVIPRHEIRELKMLPQSTMPEGLDKTIAPAEMADLLAFLTRH